MRRVLPVLPSLLLTPGPAAAQATAPSLGAPLGGLAALALLALWLAWRGRGLAARARTLEEEAARAAAGNAALREALDRAEAKSRMLDGLMAAMTDGVAVVDADLRLIGWNARFPEVTGTPRDVLRIGMPFEEVIHAQAEAGEFGLVDPEAETARRIRLLRDGALEPRLQRERPDGSRLELRRAPLPGGGFVTVYTPQPAGAAPQPGGLQAAFRAEWIARLGRLTAAAAEGELTALRSAAHALRGVAANAGWTDAAGTLAALEAAAAAADLTAARELATRLALDEPW